YVNDALYERLMALDHLWKHPGEPPARELLDACERLIKREARLLDDGEFERWLEVFSRECIYWIPLRRGNDPRREVTVEFHDRRRLMDRVARLRTGNAYSQIPPTRTCHLLSNLEIFASSADELAARANFVIQTYRLGIHRALAGWCGYLFVQEDGTWKITLKQINLIDCDEGQENNSFFL
ncbi:MAG: aromatic-ring-hydroxylating dioxygenase subunit beta, partial [Candidatus Binataceae bacterium]